MRRFNCDVHCFFDNPIHGGLSIVSSNEPYILIQESTGQPGNYDQSFGETLTGIYKFYLNIKDQEEKLKKLSEKQLPLLYSKSCEPYLENLGLKASEIDQQVYFKAQLFIPLGEKIILKTLNQDCISGFYIKKEQRAQFSESKFYIPKKIDWIIAPHTQVDWLNYLEFTTVSNTILERKFSPIFWLKQPNGILNKCFLVWW